jgi:hypothetical protein
MVQAPPCHDKLELAKRGIARMCRFCDVNGLRPPSVEIIAKDDWFVNACAYYRAQEIKICLEHCGRPCTDAPGRNWTYPGSTTDREPYGVICHELGHHVDYNSGAHPGKFWSDYGIKIMELSGEKQLTGYCPNPAEWFAEMMRLYITNHALLKLVRPKTWAILKKDWKPVSHIDYLKELGPHCPERVLKSLLNKMVKT